MVDCSKFHKRDFSYARIRSNSELKRLNLLWRWVAMDISETDPEFACSVVYMFENPDGSYGILYLIEDELSITKKIIDPIVLEPYYVIPREHSQHPYNVFSKSRIQGSMLKLFFDNDTVVIE